MFELVRDQSIQYTYAMYCDHYTATTARPFGTRPLGVGPHRARATVWHAPERGDAVVRGHRRAVVRGHGRADMRAHRLSDRWPNKAVSGQAFKAVKH